MSELLLQDTDDAHEIFGTPDNLKLHSCATLFALANEENSNSVFQKVLDKFFNGKYDYSTVEIIEE